MTTVAAAVIAFDRNRFLTEAFWSIRQQTDAPDEVFLVGNVPAPDGVQWLKVTDRDQGPKIAAAISASRSDVIAFLDDDDLWQPYKTTAVRHVFDSPEVGFYNHAHTEFYEGVRSSRPLWKILRDARGGYERYGERHYYGNASSMAVRRVPLIPRIPDFDRMGLAIDDGIFWTAGETGARMVFDPTPLTRVRIHGQNSSRDDPVILEVPRRRYQTYSALSEFVVRYRHDFDKKFARIQRAYWESSRR